MTARAVDPTTLKVLLLAYFRDALYAIVKGVQRAQKYPLVLPKVLYTV